MGDDGEGTQQHTATPPTIATSCIDNRTHDEPKPTRRRHPSSPLPPVPAPPSTTSPTSTPSTDNCNVSNNGGSANTPDDPIIAPHHRRHDNDNPGNNNDNNNNNNNNHVGSRFYQLQTHIDEINRHLFGGVCESEPGATISRDNVISPDSVITQEAVDQPKTRPRRGGGGMGTPVSHWNEPDLGVGMTPCRSNCCNGNFDLSQLECEKLGQDNLLSENPGSANCYGNSARNGEHVRTEHSDARNGTAESIGMAQVEQMFKNLLFVQKVQQMVQRNLDLQLHQIKIALEERAMCESNTRHDACTQTSYEIEPQSSEIQISDPEPAPSRECVIPSPTSLSVESSVTENNTALQQPVLENTQQPIVTPVPGEKLTASQTVTDPSPSSTPLFRILSDSSVSSPHPLPTLPQQEVVPSRGRSDSITKSGGETGWSFRRALTKLGAEVYATPSRTDVPEDLTPLSALKRKQFLPRLRTSFSSPIGHEEMNALLAQESALETPVKRPIVRVIIPEFHSVKDIQYNGSDTVGTFLKSLQNNYDRVLPLDKYCVFLPLCSQAGLSGLHLDLSRTLDSYSISSLVTPTFILYHGELQEKLLDQPILEMLRTSLNDKNLLKWINALNNWTTFYEENRRKLRDEIRHGLPDILRGFIWQKLCKSDMMEENHPTAYDTFLCLDPNNTFQRKIKADLQRTFPTHPYFISQAGQTSLFRVLFAYSNKDHTLGYCQGLNFIAGIFLLQMNEQNTFWALDGMLNNHKIRGLFLPDVPYLRDTLKVFETLVARHLSDLSNRFISLDFPFGAFTSWFLTLFSASFPIPLVQLIWDWFFVEDFTVVFKVALAFLKLHKEKLLHIEVTEFIPFIQSEPNRMTPQDYESLLTLAAKFSIPSKILADLGI